MVETEIDDSFVEKVMAKKELVLPNLKDLDLSHNTFTNSYPKLMKTIQEKCHLLSNLSLVSCKLAPSTDITLVQTFTDPHFPATPTLLYLKRLDLSSSLSGDDHARQLANSSALRYLEFLKLKHCQFGN
jgi:Ran GTPase-activating protein (RanGAP) involved in mRNA processing and transport